MSKGAPLSPNQGLKNQRDNPERVTKLDRTPGPQEITRQRNNSGECEVLALQNKKALRTELQPLKAETDNPWPSAGEDSMQFGRDVAWSNPRTAMLKTEASTSRRERGEAENLRHPDHMPAALSEKSDFRKRRSRATIRVSPAHETPR